jgi:hypothetical protein
MISWDALPDLTWTTRPLSLLRAAYPRWLIGYDPGSGLWYALPLSRNHLDAPALRAGRAGELRQRIETFQDDCRRRGCDQWS